MADFELAGVPDGDILTVTFTGKSTPANAAAMTRRYFELVIASEKRKVLIDIRRLEGRLSGAETYFLVRDLPVKPVPEGIKTAIVEATENREYADFLETTAANAGVYFRSFVDYDQALSWLHSPPATPHQA